MAKKKVVVQAKKALAEKKIREVPDDLEQLIREHREVRRLISSNTQKICALTERIGRIVAALSTAKPIRKDM